MNGINCNRDLKSNFLLRKLSVSVEKNQFTLPLIILIISIMIFSVCILSTKVNAEKPYSREKVIASVRIEKGDSLWSIAKEYITDDYSSIHAYIKEIKKSNGLISDVIHEGSYLIIPHYKNRY